MNKHWNFVVAGAILVAIGLAHSFLGIRLIGFEKSVGVDTSRTAGPEQVISHTDHTFTLSDGRVYRTEEDLNVSAEFQAADGHVWVDVNNGVVYGRYRCLYCGFDRRDRMNLITIPLYHQIMPTHRLQPIGEVRPALPTAAKPTP